MSYDLLNLFLLQFKSYSDKRPRTRNNGNGGAGDYEIAPDIRQAMGYSLDLADHHEAGLPERMGCCCRGKRQQARQWGSAGLAAAVGGCPFLNLLWGSSAQGVTEQTPDSARLRGAGGLFVQLTRVYLCDSSGWLGGPHGWGGFPSFASW